MSAEFCLLVVAKAPVPGLAKTRLCPPATPEQAAGLAAAALLDTLDAVLATPGARPTVAITGDLTAAARSAELTARLAETTVFEQRGDGFGERLAHAHADAGDHHPGLPIVQIGMDTPQVTPALLREAADRLAVAGTDAVLGPAADGGWWALGLHDPKQGSIIADVPMSRADTGELTMRALSAAGLTVSGLNILSDVDTMADAERVAALAGGDRFPAAVAAIGQGGTNA